MSEMENARKLVALEERAKAAVTELAKVSLDLRSLDKDIKISGWDWERSGNIAAISTQGNLNFKIVNTSDRK